MTNSSDNSQTQYAVYRMRGKDSYGLEYTLSAGPFTERKQALRKAEELNQSEPEVYFAYVVSEYQGESWSPERARGYDWDAEDKP